MSGGGARWGVGAWTWIETQEGSGVGDLHADAFNSFVEFGPRDSHESAHSLAMLKSPRLESDPFCLTGVDGCSGLPNLLEGEGELYSLRLRS